MSSGHCPNSVAHGVGPICTNAPDEQAEEAAPFLPRSAGGGRGVRQPVLEGGSNTSNIGTPWSRAGGPPNPCCFLAHAKTDVTVLFHPAVFFLHGSCTCRSTMFIGHRQGGGDGATCRVSAAHASLCVHPWCQLQDVFHDIVA